MSWSSLILNFSTTSEEITALDFLNSLNHFYSRLVPFVQEKKLFQVSSTYILHELQEILKSLCRYHAVKQILQWIQKHIIITLLIFKNYLTDRAFDKKPARRKNNLIESFFSDSMMCAHVVYPILQVEVFKQTVYRNHFLFRRSKLIDVTLTFDIFFDGTYLLS